MPAGKKKVQVEVIEKETEGGEMGDGRWEMGDGELVVHDDGQADRVRLPSAQSLFKRDSLRFRHTFLNSNLILILIPEVRVSGYRARDSAPLQISR